MPNPTYLVDTHCLIWFQDNSIQIPGRIMQILQSPENTLVFSQISLLEIAIKQSIGKLPHFVATVSEIYEQSINDGFNFLPISNALIIAYGQVPLFEDHRDPFDRLLIATAISLNASILSADKNFKLYNRLVDVLW